MKTARKSLGLLLALAMLVSLTIPVSAATVDDYWAAYEAGWSEGYDAGYAAYLAGDAATLPIDTDAARQAGYAEGYTAGYEDAIWEQQWAQDEATMVNQDITAAGGVPGTTNVKVNGACLATGGVRPENQNGRVMIPMRAICEALGAEVAYDQATRTATITTDGKTITHVIGTDQMTVQMEEESETVQMDCASYLKSSTTMVPVRFVAEALDCSVSWDGTYKTVVILNLDALRETYDSQLTVFNLLLRDSATMMEAGKNYAATERMDATVTVFDTLAGDKQYKGSLELEGVQNREAANYDVKVDLTDLMEVLQQSAGDFMTEEDAQILQMLRVMEFEIIYDQQNQQFYLKSPLFQDAMAYSGWVQVDLKALFGADLSLLLTGAQDMTLFEMMAAMSGESGFYCYENLTQLMDAMVMIWGDQNFKQSGNTYTMEMDLEDMLRLSGLTEEEIQQALAESAGETMQLQMQVKKTGEASCDYSLSMQMQADEMALSMDCTKTGMNAEVQMTLHMKNVFKAVLTMESEMKQTNQAVQTQPPAGEVVLELEELVQPHPALL